MRKLAIGALSFSTAVFASCYFLPYGILRPLSFVLICAAVIFIIINYLRFRGPVICLISLSLGFLCFFTGCKQTLQRVYPYEGRTLSINAELLDYPETGSSSEYFTVKIKSGELKGMKAIVYSKAELSEGTAPGDRLIFRAKVKPGDVKYGERDLLLPSKGIFIILNSRSDILRERADSPLKALPVKLNHTLAELADEIFPDDVAPFMKSLLLGDKKDYYRQDGLSKDMSRAGLAHIVAISGLHIVFLAGILKALLGNSRRSSACGIAAVWFFVLLTGCSHSAVRAGIMQTVLLSAALFERENDSPTSLSLALAIILLVNPYAAASVGLQLSFAATAGILCFSGRVNKFLLKPFRKKKLISLVRLPAASLSASVGAAVFTLPLTAVHFGTVSVYAPLSNILCFWAVSFCFTAGFICCAAGLIFKAPAVILGHIIAWMARYIIWVAETVSELPLSTVFMDSLYGPYWLVLSYILFFAAFRSRERAAVKILLPSLLSIGFLVSFHSLSSTFYNDCSGVISALDVGQGQCICILAGENTVLYDCGGMGSRENAGDTAADYLEARGREDIDLIILSHVQKDHVNGVSRLLEQCRVKTIIIPDFDYSGNSFYSELTESAKEHNVYLYRLSEPKTISYDGLRLELFASEEPADINESSINILASIGSFDMLATGDASDKRELQIIEQRDFEDIELLIAGHHGSKSSSCMEFLREVDADTAIISCGYNSYGHPAQETLERLSECGYNILRTDLDSTVEIMIGKDYG